MDLTKYRASPYGPGSPLRGDQNQSALAAALRGFFGQEEPGSVLDPATAPNKAVNNAAQLGTIISDLVPGKAALSGVPLLAGMLRKGGRPDLFLTHGTTAQGILRWGKPLAELSQPSLGIVRDAPKTPWATRPNSVTLIGRPDVLDPVRHPGSLFNTDAWTPNFNNTLVNDYKKLGAMPKSIAYARLQDRFGHRFDKGGLNYVDDPVVSALRFPSFKAYEEAVNGAARLTPFAKATFLPTELQTANEDFLAKFGERAGLGVLRPGEGNLTETLPELAGGKHNLGSDLTEQARELLKQYRQLPQQYAELKAWGPVPITGSVFSHALVDANAADPLAVDELRQLLTSRGINVIDEKPKTQAQWKKLATRVNNEALAPYTGALRNLPQGYGQARLSKQAQSLLDLQEKLGMPGADLDALEAEIVAKIKGGK